jgi:hypothetical protein
MATPSLCIERSYPSYIKDLPCIVDKNTDIMYQGYHECVTFFSTMTGISNIHEVACIWKKENPDYRINK